MQRLNRGFQSFIRAMLGELTPTGQMWARVGVAVLIVAAGMSFDFGRQVSWLHGVFLAGLTFVAAFGPEAAYKAWQERKWGSSIAMALFSAGLLAIEFNSHQSYTAGIRGDDLAVTRVANVRFDGAQAAVKEEAGNLDIWRRQRETLSAEREQLKASSPWVTTTTADALREQDKALGDKIAAEIAGGRGGRKSGCKAVCEQLKDDRVKVGERIAAIEVLDGVSAKLAELDARIAATQATIDKKRHAASTTEHKSSVVEHSNRSLARTVAFFTKGELQPNATIETGAELSANLMMALAGTGVPAFALFVAGLYRRQEDEVPKPAPHHQPIADHVPRTAVQPPSEPSAPVSMQAARAALVPAQNTHTREIVRTDSAVWADLRSILRAA